MAGEGIEVAHGYVSIVPSTRSWDRELKKLEGRSVDVDVDADTSGASTNLDRWRAQESANAVNMRVKVDTRGASNEMRGLRRDFEMLGRSDALRLNLGAAAITGLPMLAAGIAEVTASLVQLSQAALVVPGALAGIAASGGTLVVGLTGIKDAFDALGKASDDAATSGGDMAATARAQQSASYSLRNAIQDEAQARKDVAQATKDARRELVDLNIEMRGGVISEKRAILEARKAREELMKGGFQSASDYADAQLRVEEADQRVLEVKARNAETAERLTDANSKGIANSDLVVAANERLERSQQQVAQAQAAVEASAPKASAAQENAALAMGKLSDNAREFVETLRGVADGPVADLRNLVQDNIFDGLAGQLEGLTKKAMPTFEKGLGGIGDAWNDTFTEIMSQFGEDDNLSLLDRIFGNTADAQTRMNDALDPLIEGIGTLAAAGSDSLPRLADAFVTVSERFSDFITRADQDGRLQVWIDEGITAMGNLGEIALNVGKMFTGISEAAGGTLLQNLENWTTKWANWLNSVEGQDTLRDIFDEGREMFAKWKPILEDLPDLFVGIYDAAQLYMGPLLEIVDGITSALREYPDLIPIAAGAFVAFKVAGAIGTVTDLATRLTGVGTSLDGMEGKANKAARGINAALALIVVPEIGKMLNDQIVGFLEENFPGLADLNMQLAPDVLGQKARDWLFGDNSTANGVLPTAPGQRNGQGDPSIAGIPMPGLIDTDTIKPSPGTYGLPGGTDTGGYGSGGADVFPQWVLDLADTFGVKASTYSGHQEGDRSNEHGYAPNPLGLNRGIDWSGPVENMQRLAEYLQTLAEMGIPGLEQIIWQNPSTGEMIGLGGAGNLNDSYYDSGTYGGHQNHVHTRQSAPIPLPFKTYDTGGAWPSGTLGINETGKDEFVLTPEDIEYLRSKGIDPMSIQNQALGELPNQQLSPEEQVNQWQSEGLAEVSSGRTEGYIPAGAGFSGKTGGGVAGSFINLGGEVLKGVIDTAAQAAKMGMAAGTMGASAAAGQAGGMGIDMAAQAGKRLVDWGTEMANIGVGALSEIFLPFGAPRWFSDVDPTAFMPNMTINPAAVTTGEKAFQAVAEQQGLTDPNTTQHGTAGGSAPGPGGPVQPQGPTPPDMAMLRNVAQQTAAAGPPPPQLPPVRIDNITAVDAEDVGYQISRAQNLTMMQFAGRP